MLLLYKSPTGSGMKEEIMAKKLTKAKAAKILHEGQVRGHALTKKQHGFFGARAGGAPVRRAKKR